MSRYLYYWPILFILLSNVLYDISAKSFPKGINAQAGLVIDYIVAAVAKSIPDGLNVYAGITITYSILAISNFLVFKILNPASSIITEWAQVNWAIVLLALASIGLESGYVFLYRAGWNISIGGMVCNILLVISMLVIGPLLFNETVSLRQYLGVLLCIVGLIIVIQAGCKKTSSQKD